MIEIKCKHISVAEIVQQNSLKKKLHDHTSTVHKSTTSNAAKIWQCPQIK